MQPESAAPEVYSARRFMQVISDKLRRRDRLRRQEMGQMSDLKVMAAFPLLFLNRMKVVPEAAIQEEKEDEFFLECPCGAKPVVSRESESFQKCAGCERHYLTLEQRIFVLYGNMPVPTAPAPEPQPDAE